MRRRLAVVALSTGLLAGCATVPVTGRQQLSLVSSGEMQKMAAQEYRSFLAENPPVTGTADSRLVEEVGTRIQASVEHYMKKKDLYGQIKDYKWQFNLVDSKEVNAWCMPGGRVVVYTGLLPITQDDAGLAVVMGHEIAHAIAEHGRERMSQALLQQMGGVALAVALHDKPAQTQALWLAAYGVGSTVGVVLPYSRLQESEADEIGLMFMAKAGYDPREAVELWKRMAASKKGSPPQFLSTHPADQTRIEQLQAMMPKAMKIYRKELERRGLPAPR